MPACARPRSARSPRKRRKIRAQREAIDKAERDAAEARKRDEEERRKHDEETKRKADEVAKKRFGDGETPRPRRERRARRPQARSRRGRRRRAWSAAAPAARMRPAAPPQRPTRAAKTATERPRGRLTLVTALSADEVRERSVASFRRRDAAPHQEHAATSRRKSSSAK